jgi:hypothetical protein
MSDKSKFWCRWLQVACLVVQGFGAFMVLSPSGTNSLFGPLLNFEWVAARIDPSLGPLSEAT